MKFVEKYDNFCIDLDGVMWNGVNSIPGSVETINFLLSNNKNVFFVTNNAALTKQDLKEKFFSMGLTAETSNLYTTGYAILRYFEKHPPASNKFVVLGMQGLRSYLSEAGFTVIHPPDLKIEINSLEDFANFDVDPDVGVVVAAYDTTFDYFSGLYCAACLQNGADFIGLNHDRFFIHGKAKIPASGCTIKFLETATGVKAKCVGKPMSFMFDLIAEEHKLNKERTVMIGDSMESDILMGINAGIDTVLVLSGVTQGNQVEHYDHKPSYILESLHSIIQENA